MMGEGKKALAAKLSAAHSYRLLVGTGGDGTSSEAWLCAAGCPQHTVTMLQHLRDMNSKLTSHDGSVNAETREPLGLLSRASAIPPAEISRVHCCFCFIAHLPLFKVSLRLSG